MAFLEVGKNNKQLLTSHRKKPSPTYQTKIPNPARDPGKKPLTQTRFSERSSLFTLFSKQIRASMTVEATLILPLMLVLFLQLGSVIELIRLHNHLQLELSDIGEDLAVYGYAAEDRDFASILSAVYVKEKLKENVGIDYLDESLIQNGSKGLRIWESDFVTEDDCLDLTLTYRVSPWLAPMGFRSFSLANRFYVHLWNGYQLPGAEENEVYAYVAENGVVYHKNRDCTHLRLSVREVNVWNPEWFLEQYGRRYVACKNCAKGEMPVLVFITSEGDCYHYRRDCYGLKRTVHGITKEEARAYHPCSRCSKGG